MGHAEKLIELGNYSDAATTQLDLLEIYNVSRVDDLSLEDWREVVEMQMTLRNDPQERSELVIECTFKINGMIDS